LSTESSGDHIMRRRLIAVFASALVIGSWSLGTTATSGAQSTDGSNSTSAKVPDDYSALTVVPISKPTFPFKGTDAKYHVGLPWVPRSRETGM
jgi:hypothetical protein